ncbi:MAG: DUF5011 domain-containing protein [Sulfurovum sp.]|nr:DUF5011 domain-containing protein [Sulfurovum sp.]
MKNFSNKIALLLFTTLTLLTLSGCGGTSSGNNDSVPDTTKPIITLTGESTVNIAKGVTYNDAGAIANDTVDGDITAKIIKGGDTVDTSKIGTYTITYNVTDKASNQATEVKRIVIVSEACNAMVHNGEEYCPVTSPNTGKVWLDRNLGAAQVCETVDDTACYGDYYQWGRNFDGHQDIISGTTVTQATDINNAGNEFITSTGDWASVDLNGSQRSANWSKTDGTSICPIGYRVPTYDELAAEMTPLQNFVAFKTFLKLPSTGIRKSTDGIIFEKDTKGYLLSSGASLVSFGTIGGTGSGTFPRAMGAPVRCIKH